MGGCLGVNPIRTSIWEGGKFHHPYGKPTSKCLIQIPVYTVNHTYIRSTDPTGFFPSFKTRDLVADQSLAENLTYVVEFPPLPPGSNRVNKEIIKLAKAGAWTELGKNKCRNLFIKIDTEYEIKESSHRV